MGLSKRGDPGGSILGPFLFLTYVDDPPNSFSLLDQIMFADDTNLFYTHTDTKQLSSSVNNELNKINEFFIANKLFLNVKRQSRRSSSNLIKWMIFPLFFQN